MVVRGFVESRRHPEFYLLLDQVLRSQDAPEALRALVHQRSRQVQEVLRHLIVEGQATGEVAADDPDHLVRAFLACLDGLIRWATLDPNHYHDHFPDVSIFLRMFGLGPRGSPPTRVVRMRCAATQVRFSPDSNHTADIPAGRRNGVSRNDRPSL